MADAPITTSGTGSRRQPSRLQRRAPSSLLVNRSCDWNVAIPLLSPLATSPTTEHLPPPATTATEDARQQEPQQQKCHPSAETEKIVFKKWQHPAAPFCYEPPPSTVMRPFVPVEL